MSRFRKGLIAVLLAGAALGSLIFLAGDPSTRREEDLQRLATSLARLKADATPPRIAPGTPLESHPILSAPSSAPEHQLALSGVVLRPFPKALVAIDGGAPRWIAVGEIVGDIALASVAADRAQVDTPAGLKLLSLGAAASVDAEGLRPAPARERR